MAVRVQSSFAGGELDPALHDRTTLEKYDSGLKTARNVLVARTGRVITRPPRKYFLKAKNANQTVVYYRAETYDADSSNALLFEFGPSYVRVYNEELYHNYVNSQTYQPAALLYEAVTPYSADDIALGMKFAVGYQKNQFEGYFDPASTGYSSNNHKTGLFLWVFCGSEVTKYQISSLIASMSAIPNVNQSTIFTIPHGPYSVVTSSTATGYNLDYVITIVDKFGEESQPFTVPTTLKFPISTSEKNTIDVKVDPFRIVGGVTIPGDYTGLTVNLYRRPKGIGDYGFVSSSSNGHMTGNDAYILLEDTGGAADYTHAPPRYVYDTTDPNESPSSATAGVFYGQRLVVATPEGLLASQVGRYNNFQRQYPYSADSALKIPVGFGPDNRVIDLIQSDGLIAFTNDGVYVLTGALSFENFAFVKKGEYVIDEKIPPIEIPGTVVYVDRETSSIRSLQYSTENARYNAIDLTAYSAHIFEGRKVTSIAFEKGVNPVLVTSLDDGTWATLTYEKEQQMRAWTRHDSDPRIKVLQTIDTKKTNRTYFAVDRGGQTYLEQGLPRYVTYADRVKDKEADIGPVSALMDSMKTYKTLINDSLATGQTLLLTPVVSGEWDGPLTLTCGTSGIFVNPGIGAVGTIFRFFDDDMTTYDLEVTARLNNNSITVQPNIEFPPEYATNPRLYLTFTSVSGLEHMELEYPSVKIDGSILASPNNDSETYDTPRVISGVLTLPAGRRAAILHVGRPITADVETLDVATVEQRPTLIESKILNKLYVNAFKTRGLFVGSEFPADNKVKGMEDEDDDIVGYDEDEDGVVEGNSYRKPLSRRIECDIAGQWTSQGRACIRQVDPDHFEILSIIPDLEDLRR